MEIWKDIFGFENYYEVSNFGNIRNKNTKKLLKYCLKKDNRPDFSLYVKAKRYHMTPHKAVLEAFVCPRPKGLEGCHYDGNPLNNNLENLRWDTPKNNHADMVRHGNHFKGHSNKQAKLTQEQANAIKIDNRIQRRIAEEYKVSPQTICRIKKGLTYIHNN